MVLAALTVLGATAAAGQSDDHQTTVKFVMRPDAAVSTHDQPAALDALKSDSPLVQTVIGVLGSRSMLRKGAVESGVTLTPDYTIESVAEPGSTLINSTITGPDRAVVDTIADGYGRAAPAYVSASYSAYVLERLSIAPGGDGTGPSRAQVVALALLVGLALGVALVAAELGLEPRLRTWFTRPAAAPAARASTGAGERGDPPRSAGGATSETQSVVRRRGITPTKPASLPIQDPPLRPWVAPDAAVEKPSENGAPPESATDSEPNDPPEATATSKAAAASDRGAASKRRRPWKRNTASKPDEPPEPAAETQPTKRRRAPVRPEDDG